MAESTHPCGPLSSDMWFTPRVPTRDTLGRAACALAAVAPLALVPGGLSRFVLAKLAVVAAAVALAGLAASAGRLPRGVALLVAASAAWLVVSALAGAAPLAQLVGRWPRYEGLVALPVYAGALWAGARLLGPATTTARVDALRGALSVAGLVAAVVATVELFGHRPLGGDAARPGSVLGNASQQGAFGATVVAVLLPAVVRARRPLPVAGLVAGVVLTAASGSRAALLGALAAVVLVVVVERRGWPTPALAGAGLAVLAVALPTTRDRLSGVDELAAATVSGRSILWRDTAHLLLGRPLTGVGPSGFVDAWWPAASERWHLEVGDANPPDSPHTAVLQVLGAGGFLLLALTIALVAVTAVRGVRSFRASDDDRRALLLGAGGALVAGVVTLSAGFTHAATTPLLCLLAGALVGAPPGGRRWVGRAVAVGAGVWFLVLAVACVGEVRTEQAVTLAASGQSDRADAAFRQARALRPWDPDLALLATQAFGAGAAAGDRASASRTLEWSDRSLASTPDSLDAARNRAIALAALGRVDEARALLDGLLARDPMDVDLLVAAGTLAAQDGDLDTALRRLHRATELDPGNELAWTNLEAVARAAGDATELDRVRDRG